MHISTLLHKALVNMEFLETIVNEFHYKTTEL